MSHPSQKSMISEMGGAGTDEISKSVCLCVFLAVCRLGTLAIFQYDFPINKHIFFIKIDGMLSIFQYDFL